MCESEKMTFIQTTVPDDDILINDDLSFLEVVMPRVDRELAEKLIEFWRSTSLFLLGLLVIAWFYYRTRIYLYYFGPKLSNPGFASPKSRALSPLALSPKSRTVKLEL